MTAGFDRHAIEAVRRCFHVGRPFDVPDLERLIKLQQLDTTIEDAGGRSPRIPSASPTPTRGWPKRPSASTPRSSASRTTRRRAARSRRTPPSSRAGSPSSRTSCRRSRPTANTRRCSTRSRPRRRDLGARRGEGARADDGSRRDRGGDQAGRSGTRGASARRSSAEKAALAGELTVVRSDAGQGVASARSAAVARSSRRLLAMFEQVARARKGIAICRPRATASARCATCGCARRCFSWCGRTTASSSATAASAFCTTCLRRRRPRRRHPHSVTARRALRSSSADPSDEPAFALRTPARRRRPSRTSTAARAAIPGPAGYGVRIERDDGTVVELKEAIGVATNNVAEYRGLLAALRWAAQHGIETLHMRSDSELLVKQMSGEYRVKNPGLQPLWRRRATWPADLRDVQFEHVRREFNKDADRLANEAMDAAPHVRPELRAQPSGRRRAESRCLITRTQLARWHPQAVPPAPSRLDKTSERPGASRCTGRREICSVPGRPARPAGRGSLRPRRVSASIARGGRVTRAGQETSGR